MTTPGQPRPLIGHRPGQARAGARLRLRNRHPTITRPTRSTTASYTDEEMTAFLAGEWVTTPISTWVHAARYIEEVGILECQFDNGHVHSYPCDRSTAMAFGFSPSKGGAIHDLFLANGVTGQSI